MCNFAEQALGRQDEGNRCKKRRRKSLYILGVRSLNPPPLDLKDLFEKESNADEPILIMIAPGADPSQELEEVAKQTVGAEKYHQIPMGQGQQELAVQLLKQCAESGEWLCLKNLHLVIAWLPQLEKARFNLLLALPFRHPLFSSRS